MISSGIESIYPICLFVTFRKPKDDGTVFDSANKRYYLLLYFNGYIICFVCLCTNFLDISTIHSFHISNGYNLEKSIIQTKKDFSKISLEILLNKTTHQSSFSVVSCLKLQYYLILAKNRNNLQI